MKSFKGGEIVTYRDGLAEVIAQNGNELIVEVLGDQAKTKRFATINLETENGIALADARACNEKNSTLRIR